MKRLDLIRSITSNLGRLSNEIRIANAAGHFDINKVVEDFLVPLLSKLFGCANLQNQNRVKLNFPAVDLGDRTARISFQVTSDPSSSKVSETLKKFQEHRLYAAFDRVFMLVLTEKQSSYTSKVLAKQIGELSVPFSIEENIIDLSDLAAKLNDATDEDLQLIKANLDSAFSENDRHLEFKEKLHLFLEYARSKIEVEKRTKKYIPAVFAETTSAKDDFRIFAHPLFFYRRIDDLIARIRPDHFLEFSKKAHVAPLTLDTRPILQFPEPTTLVELSKRSDMQKRALSEFRKLLSPFSWYRHEEDKYEPLPEHEVEWDIFRVAIEGHANGIVRLVDEALAGIELVQSKIFLITSMAGQGKTNFICDLFENMFTKFVIPSIFIPARDLNAFSAPDRIYKFITDNRYAPQVANLHDLLKLLNSIAAENGKPFVIAIDGINEVGALEEFNAELKTFLAAICQYDWIKIVLTCRSEFFDQRFSDLLNENFSELIHRVRDLRSEMSDAARDRMLKSYLSHFNISLQLSESVGKFLTADLLLLRIFCEIHQGAPAGVVKEIYKGQLFEAFIRKKVSEFPHADRKHVVPSLHKIADAMLASDSFTNLNLRGFDQVELDIIELLISEDIVLRREVDVGGLSAIGAHTVSFTYDELRDYILADYIVDQFFQKDPDAVERLFGRLPQLPIYEGVFRYVYILARKSGVDPLITICENEQHFLTHYATNLGLLQPDLQDDTDVRRVRQILGTVSMRRSWRYLAAFLYSRLSVSEPINIGVLVEHINGLAEVECRGFIRTILSSADDLYAEDWIDTVQSILNNLLVKSDAEFNKVDPRRLAFALQIAGFADLDLKEQFFGRFAGALSEDLRKTAIALAGAARSETILDVVAEVAASTERV